MRVGNLESFYFPRELVDRWSGGRGLRTRYKMSRSVVGVLRISLPGTYMRVTEGSLGLLVGHAFR